MAARTAVAAAAALCAVERVPSVGLRHALLHECAAYAREFRARMAGCTVWALPRQYFRSGDSDPGGATRAGHAGSVCLCPLHVSRQRGGVHGRAAPTDGHARRADRRELSHDRLDGTARHDLRHCVAVLRVGVRHFSVASGVQDRAARIGRRGARGRRQRVAGALARVCAARPPGVCRLRAGVDQSPLEQLPVAAHRHELRRDTSAHGRPTGVCVDRSGHRLDDDHGRDADDRRAAVRRIFALSAPVRAVVHACGHSTNGMAARDVARPQ